ncbi:MAG: hypothetical protein ACYC63_10450 [Armatimonadota bacterium]
MWRLALTITLAFSCALACAQDLTATVKEERLTVPDEPGRQGLQMVKRNLTFGPMAVRYQQLIDPKNADAPVNQRYADYILGLDFPRYTWNWDLQYFLEAMIARPGQKPLNATRATLQKATYILQQGPRVVADMVWTLPPLPDRPAYEFVVRMMAFADQPDWLYLRAGLEGDPEARITQLRLHSYPFTTSGPPERQRWVTTLTRGLQMSNTVQPLQPAEEWALVMHNKMAQEDGGTLLVMDPKEIKSGGAVGVYPIEIQMQPGDGSEVHVAMGYFRDTPWSKAVDSFRAAAPERLKRLQAVDWNAPVDVAGWQKQKQAIEELLTLSPAAKTDFAPEWTSLLARADQALAQIAANPNDSAAARNLVIAGTQADDLKARLYDPALKALIEQATQ